MKRLAVALSALCGLAAWSQDINVQELHKKCGSQIKWISDPDPSDGIGRPLPDADRATLLDEAKSKAKKQKKPIFWYIHRFQGNHMYRHRLVDSYAQQVFFTDEDLVNLIDSRCVPLRMACDAEIAGLTKLKSLDNVEPAIVLMSAEGEILWKVDRIRTFDADWLAWQLRAALKKCSTPPASDNPEELIRWGELEQAKAVLEKKEDAHSKYLLATVYRRLHQADKAREALAAAKGEPLAGVEEALLNLRQGKLDEAKEGFAKAMREKTDRSAEAMYYLACAEFLQSREEQAVGIWRQAAQSYPQSPWGWKSASNLTKHKDTTPDGAAIHGFESLLWGPEAIYTTALSSTVWARTEKDVDDITKRAVQYLLGQQRSTGCWADARYAFWPGPEILPNTRMAITALAAAALFEWRALDPDRIDKALEKAEKFMADDSTVNRGRNEEMYADCYRILYYGRRKMKDPAEPLVQKLIREQKEDGYWAHEYENAFATAVVVQALFQARELGIKVPEKTIRNAASALKAQRGNSGTFAYDTNHTPPAAKDSSARAPLCESGLLLAGESSKKNVARALEDYWKFYDRQERVRKCDFHSDGELGGFFFFHAVFHSTQAAKMVDAEARDANLKKFLEEVVKLPEIDGSFIDDHEIGKSYGTAMALLVLRNCVPAK
jgi:tetratricopeptide (TPR) repeat protein